MKENKKTLKDDKLDLVSGGVYYSTQKTMECIFCGGEMTTNRKGKMTGGTYTCSVCGATYNPSIANPWTPGDSDEDK